MLTQHSPFRSRLALVALTFAATLAIGCPPPVVDGGPTDAGSADNDAGGGERDAGPGNVDAGANDAGQLPIDAGVADAGEPDAGVPPPTDAGGAR